MGSINFIPSFNCSPGLQSPYGLCPYKSNSGWGGAPPVGAAVMSEIPNMEEILKRVVTVEKTVPLCLHIFYRGC